MIYFPNLLPFSDDIAEVPLEVSEPLELTQESSMSEEVTNTSAFGSLVGSTGISASSKIVKPKQAVFNNCLDESCSSFNVTTSDGISSKLVTGTNTAFFCVNKRINGTDMTKYNINFDIEDDLYSPISENNISTILSLYRDKEPIQYESIGDIVNWVSIYLDSCTTIK